jgi:hypothetical protein
MAIRIHAYLSLLPLWSRRGDELVICVSACNLNAK